MDAHGTLDFLGVSIKPKICGWHSRALARLKQTMRSCHCVKVIFTKVQQSIYLTLVHVTGTLIKIRERCEACNGA